MRVNEPTVQEAVKETDPVIVMKTLRELKNGFR